MAEIEYAIPGNPTHAEAEYILANHKIGLAVGLAVSGRLVTPEMIVAMGTQSYPVHLSTGYIMIKGLPVEEARCVAVDEAIKVGAKYLWFVDDDTIPPSHAARALIYQLENNPDAMVCGGLYVTKEDIPQPVVFQGIGLGSYWHWKKGDVFECTGMGAGCMMIRTEVFKTLEKPYFKFIRDIPSDINHGSSCISEDIYFCEMVRKEGYKVLAHGGVLCRHFDVNTGRVFGFPDDCYPMRPREAESSVK